MKPYPLATVATLIIISTSGCIEDSIHHHAFQPYISFDRECSWTTNPAFNQTWAITLTIDLVLDGRNDRGEVINIRWTVITGRIMDRDLDAIGPEMPLKRGFPSDFSNNTLIYYQERAGNDWGPDDNDTLYVSGIQPWFKGGRIQLLLRDSPWGEVVLGTYRLPLTFPEP
jgi:hypothetical protein